MKWPGSLQAFSPEVFSAVQTWPLTLPPPLPESRTKLHLDLMSVWWEGVWAGKVLPVSEVSIFSKEVRHHIPNSPSTTRVRNCRDLVEKALLEPESIQGASTAPGTSGCPCFVCRKGWGNWEDTVGGGVTVLGLKVPAPMSMLKWTSSGSSYSFGQKQGWERWPQWRALKGALEWSVFWRVVWSHLSWQIPAASAAEKAAPTGGPRGPVCSALQPSGRGRFCASPFAHGSAVPHVNLWFCCTDFQSK